MSATRTRRNGAPEAATVAPESAPELVAPESATVAPEGAPELAPESAPVLDVDAAIESTEIDKATRVYVAITDRAPMSDGRLACVSREQRADGSQGEYLLSVIRKNPKDKTESVQHSSIDTYKQAKAALAAIGVRILKD